MLKTRTGVSTRVRRLSRIRSERDDFGVGPGLVLHLRAGLLLHLLRTPLVQTHDSARAVRSRWAWVSGGLADPTYTLTPLGIAHSLVGLNICTIPRDEEGHPH